MPDWSSSMQRTYEYYMVDPGTWKDKQLIDTVTSCTLNRDSEVETLGSATIDIEESVGECYIREYLITIQNGVKEKHALGTHLVQTPAMGFDGKVRNVSMDTYTPLLELKEGQPPIGFYIPKGSNVMAEAYRLVRENARAPVVEAKCDTTLFYDFVADPNDTWLTYISDLISNAKYSFDLDAWGRILFAPDQDTASLQPVWTYTDNNSSILYPDFNLDHDLYGIPNVVEVIYSDTKNHFYAKVVNDDPNSPISTVNRGREIPYRDPNPNIVGNLSQDRIQEYAEQLLRRLSTLEYTITYTHGYCPVRVGDCVRFNYNRAGLTDVKARVISQSIKCDSACPVTEKAIFTNKLWDTTTSRRQPAPVRNVIVTTIDHESINIAWTVANNAAKYKVYRSLTPEGEYVAIADVATFEYLDIDLTFGTRYYYKVRPYTEDGVGGEYTAYRSAITDPIGITKQPEDISVKSGVTIEFNVEAVGDGLTYQWEYLVLGSTSGWRNNTMTGNTTATLTFKAQAYHDGYMYRCLITDAAGNTIRTNEVTLYIIT